jgi:ubiquinone/menaquinone biosynthesis C-methylase UbiE
MRESPPSPENYWYNRFQEAAKKHQSDEEISLWTKPGLEKRLNVFFRVFDEAITSSKKVLDLGCGPGTYARLMTQRGHKVVGVDYSTAMIYKAMKKSKGLGIQYVVVDAHALPFAQDSFDVVASVGVFQTFSTLSALKVIAEIKRVLLSKTGSLFLITLNAFSIKVLTDRLRLLLSTKASDTGPEYKYTHRYNPYQLSKLLQEQGFKQIKLQGIFILPRNLSFLEPMFDRKNLPPLALPVAHSFLLKTNLTN